MGLEIVFEGKIGFQVHNWDIARAKIQEGSDNNVFEALELFKNS
jgi:hypothetical protein